MSIFGRMDATTVSTNPYKIDAGDYEAEVTGAEFGTNRDGGRQLVIEYTITSEESEFKGNKAKEYFPMVDEDLTLEMFEMLPPEEQKKIRTSNANLKGRLCGRSEKNKGLGVAEDDLNDASWSPSVLKGIPVRLGISNGSTGEYTNVKFASIIE
jgi:hypothetical protein